MFERSRRTGVRRQLFLLDQRLIITKEKDADGLYVFKDSLKVHSLSVAEKEGDSPNRFAVGTGTVGDWDQYYLLEASSAETKQKWLQALKDIMKGQYELLKGGCGVVYVCVYTFVCVCLCIGVHVLLHVCALVFTCVPLYVCALVCACLCV